MSIQASPYEITTNPIGIPDQSLELSGHDPEGQTQALLYDEARTVYLGNLARRDNGVPPLRWNRQLTHAARWFSWDSVENRPSGFCGHDDTLGRAPWDRAPVFGYLGFAGAENAFCGYVTPESAIQGWMNSEGHRANLLDPGWREIGLGYYRRESDGRGYVTQDFGNDAVFAPVIIENEAISTNSHAVNLYIYDRSTGGGFAGLAAATQMMVSNDSHFSGATWEAYNANKSWTLATGDGWRTVYVKTRDLFNRSMTVSDTIYVGANVPLDELGSAQMSTTQAQVTIYNLNGGALPQVQFSPGWLADDTHGTFGKLWGNGERVNDAAAWGGTAFRLSPGDGESSAWVWDTSFIKDAPMVAYFRLKVNNNTSSSEVARVTINGGGTEYGPLSLRGTDFRAPNQYQEFALNFTFHTNPDDDFLIFQFWRSGSADVYVDAVSIFSAPQPITSPLTWSVPGNNYRGQGVWVRYTNGSQFSAISEGETTPYTISGNAGAGGVTLSYVDGTSKTATADGGGNYSIIVPYNWSGTVTPSKSGYTFSPTERTYTNVTSNQAAQDYTATAFPPTPISPSGTLDGVSKPTFSWGAIADATSYSLAVYSNPAAAYLIQDSVAPSYCDSSQCSYPSPITLANGSYKWKVLANLPGGNRTAFSSWMNFTITNVTLPPPPYPPTPLSPTGTVTATHRPTFTWSQVPNAAFYRLGVLHIATNTYTILLNVYPACAAGVCSYTHPTTDLPNGAYRFKVLARNASGLTAYSSWLGFSVNCDKPVAPKLVAPMGTIPTNPPTFQWNPVSGATGYRLAVYANATASYVILTPVAPGACSGTVCSYTPTASLAGGSHKFKMLTYNVHGASGYSDWMSFTVP